MRRNLPSSSSSDAKKEELEELECSMRVYKRRRGAKRHETGIGDLPEHILHHIFSFVEISQAIQTCILSKRWRYFWVSLPTLNFDYKTRKKGDLMDFVDRVLMFRGSNSNIHEFKFFVDDSRIDATDRLNTWILVCVIRNVQQLTLAHYFPENFQFHHSLFTCKSLTKLVVTAKYNRISLPRDSIILPRLKTLSLTYIKFQDEYVMDQLFSSCPILESLTLHWCEFPHINVYISSPLLQHLVIANCTTTSNALVLGAVDTNKFQLCAPNLLSLCWDNDISIHCDPKNLSSLVKADISTGAYGYSKLSKEKIAMYAPFLMNLLRGLHNVEDLEISPLFLWVISGDPDLFDRQPTKFCNLRCLKLEGIRLSKDCINGISYLLKNSPNIETLSIEDHHDFWEAAGDLLVMRLMQHIQLCNLRCLKMHTFRSGDLINAIACVLKIGPNIETLSYTVYPYEDYTSADDIMNPYCDEINSDRVIKKDYWKTVLYSECLLNHLKCFEFRDVEGRMNELEFLEILLKNAILLDKLLIVFKTTYSDTSGRQIKFSEKVFTFPRASSSVVILFKFSEKPEKVL